MELDEIKKVVFKKGDILVLKWHSVLPAEARRNIVESCQAVLEKVNLKDKVGVMVLEQGLDISVLTQEEIKEGAI